MAGQSILNPICIHPLASPASSHSSLASLDDSRFWDCDFHQPPSRAASAATSFVAPPSSSLATAKLSPLSPTCNLPQRLMDILNFTTEPSSTPPQVSTIPYDPLAHASPAPHRPTHPASPRTSTMLSPLTPAYTHKMALSHPSRPSPLSTMSFAAPVPRLPLASVLRHLDASWAPRTPDPCDADATRGSQRDDDLPQLGLGLVMGAACLPIQLPRPYLESELESLSPSRYSRRLRSLAPAPLQLASPTPRTPFRSLTQAQTPVPASTRRTPCSAAFVDVPLDTHCASAFGDVSISPQSERRASISSAMASISTAPTSLVFPGESENVTMGRNTNPPSYVDLLSWHRSVSRSLDSPLSPLAAKSIHTGTSSAHKAMRSPATPATPARRSSLGNENPFTPGLPPDAVPPPLRRTEWVPLPELTDEELPSSDVQLLSPLRADLRLDLGVEDLALRAESCSETIARASLSLCSCSLLREPEAIVSLIDRLRATFASVQRALDGTPADFVAGGSDAKRIWYAKHWQIIASLDRNLNLFYLLAHQIEERPPRIHRLAPLLDKLSTYQVKFADLARRITLSHEKLRFLGLRAELSLPPTPARTSIDDKERVLRYDARAARQEGRARRREIREEITRVRGRIRAIREREVDLTRNDENMTVCGDDEDIEREKWRQGWW